jgi:hypothetical protein
MTANALDQYFDLINNALNRTTPDELIENHHILPKSICKEDPEWTARNDKLTVPLTLEEHYTAHKLLKEAFPDDLSIVRGFEYFNTLSKTLGESTPQNYARAKKIVRQKMSEAMKGRTKETHEYLRINGEKMSAESHPKFDDTMYILAHKDNMNKIYIGTQYRLVRELGLNRSHLCRMLRWVVHKIPESGGGKRKWVRGYTCVGVINKNNVTRRNIDPLVVTVTECESYKLG